MYEFQAMLMQQEIRPMMLSLLRIRTRMSWMLSTVLPRSRYNFPAPWPGRVHRSLIVGCYKYCSRLLEKLSSSNTGEQKLDELLCTSALSAYQVSGGLSSIAWKHHNVARLGRSWIGQFAAITVAPIDQIRSDGLFKCPATDMGSDQFIFSTW